MTKQLPKTDASTVNVADYIVERLAAEGTDHCLGVQNKMPGFGFSDPHELRNAWNKLPE